MKNCSIVHRRVCVMHFRFISISDRLSSRDSIDIDNSLNMHNHITNDVDIKSNDTESAQTVDELDTTLNATLLDFVTETMNDSVDAASRPRTSTTISEFDVIDKDIDVKCNSRICSCSKENSGLKNKKVSGKREIGGLKVGNDVDVLDLADTTATMKDHSPNCDYHANDIRYVNGKEGDTLSNINERILEAGDSMKVKSLKSGDKTVNVDFYLGFSEDVGKGNVSDTMDIERFNCDKYSENSAVGDNLGVLLAKSEGISEAFLPHTQYSINEISSDLVGTTSNADQYQNTVKDACDENKTDVQNYDGFIKDSYRTSHNDECTDRTVENSGELKESYGNNSEGITEAFQPHLQFSINEDLSDISVEPIDSENRSKQDSDKLKTDNSFNSNKNEIMDAHVNQIKLLDGMGDCEYVKGKLADETGIMLDYSVDADKFKENNGPINGLWRGDGNITCSSTERSLEEETRHRRIR